MGDGRVPHAQVARSLSGEAVAAAASFGQGKRICSKILRESCATQNSCKKMRTHVLCASFQVFYTATFDDKKELRELEQALREDEQWAQTWQQVTVSATCKIGVYGCNAKAHVSLFVYVCYQLCHSACVRARARACVRACVRAGSANRQSAGRWRFQPAPTASASVCCTWTVSQALVATFTPWFLSAGSSFFH